MSLVENLSLLGYSEALARGGQRGMGFGDPGNRSRTI